MNRTIKFRGKLLGNGEWVYGDLLHINGGCLIYYGSQIKCELIEVESDIAVEMSMDEIAPVDPDTVGQFTGLHDCRGKGIYEGDILQPHGNNLLLEVCFHEGGFACKWNDGSCDFFPNHWAENVTAVISNIHDDPGLLEGGAK